MSKQQVSSVSISFGGAMFLLFLGLRLTDHIDWAWYWVAAPLWMPALFVLGITIGVGLVAGCAYLVAAAMDRARRSKRRKERK